MTAPGLSIPWERRKPSYEFIIVGSGYGGAVAAARLATADLSPKPSICVLERGREWKPGDFPDKHLDLVVQHRNAKNPLGLYGWTQYRGVSVINASAVGGTSLISAGVAVIPTREKFARSGWPEALGYDRLLPYYRRAQSVLGANPHPRAFELART